MSTGIDGLLVRPSNRSKIGKQPYKGPSIKYVTLEGRGSEKV